MIIRLTAKLGNKIKIVPSEALPAAQYPITDWSAQLFTVERRQYILVSNTLTLFSVVMPGRGVTSDRSFLQRMRTELQLFLHQVGYDHVFQNLLEPGLEVVSYSKALNRSVTGSMNELVFIAKYLLTWRDLSLSELSAQLNETPMSCLKYNPEEAFRTLVDEAGIRLERPEEK
ncbi:DUF6933 domain-containing protein [Gemmatimonadota bacterium]